jgi:putative phosphoribosyl transferase
MPPLKDRVVILVDDGLATGSTMRAAVQAVKQRQPSRVVVAVPVGASETCAELLSICDEVVCGRTPTPFSAVGQWYLNFDQTTDEEVQELLSRSASLVPHHTP